MSSAGAVAPTGSSPLLAAGLCSLLGGAAAAGATALFCFGLPLAHMVPQWPTLPVPVAVLALVLAAGSIIAAGQEAAHRSGHGVFLGAATGLLAGLLVSAMATAPAAAVWAAQPLLGQVLAGEFGDDVMVSGLVQGVVAILESTARAHVATAVLGSMLGAVGGGVAALRHRRLGQQASRPWEPGELRALGSMGTGISIAAAVVLVVLLTAFERLRVSLVGASDLPGAGDGIAMLPLVQAFPWLAVGGLLTCLAASRQLAIEDHGFARRSVGISLAISFIALLLAIGGGLVQAPLLGRSAPFLIGMGLLLLLQIVATRAALRWAAAHRLDAPPIPSVAAVVGRCLVEGMLLPALTWGAGITGGLALNLLAVAYTATLQDGSTGPLVSDQIQALLRANLAVVPAAGALFIAALPFGLLSRASEARRWRRQLARQS